MSAIDGAELYTYATAAEIARAVVMAARHTGEDAIECATSPMHGMCRLIALDALRAAFPQHNKSAMARGVGFGAKHGAAPGAIIMKKRSLGSKWPSAVVHHIATTLAGSVAPNVPRVSESVTSDLMGDPAPGRSALDMRRSSQGESVIRSAP